MSRAQGSYVDRSLNYPARRRKSWARVGRNGLITGFLVLLLAYVATYYWAEGLWFEELDFLSEFLLRSRTQILLGAITLFGSLGFVFANFNAAEQLKFNRNCLLPNQANLSIGLGLRTLLPILFFLGFAISGNLLHHAQIAITELTTTRAAIPTPLGLSFRENWKLVLDLIAQPILLALVVGSAIALVTFPLSLLRVVAVVLSLCFSIIAVEEWARVLPALNPSSFDQIDPVFKEELSFYIFRLPLWELIEFWLSGLFVFMLAAVMLEYLLAGNTFSQGRFAGFSSGQQRHLSAIASGLLAVTAMGDWIRRYELLYSPQGVSYGASFTDIYVGLPVNTALSFIALGLAVTLAGRALGGKFLTRRVRISGGILKARPIVGAIAIYLLLTLIGNTLAPWLVQRLIVQPNELQREIPYIERTIAFTRDAFDLANIEAKEFDPQGTLTTTELEANESTIDNIRLWDTRPLLESNRQLQQIRLYYEFADADVDRYSFAETATPDADTISRRQVLISARELNYERVPAEAQTWVNEHLIYTHGYGFTMSPVNTAGPSGLPEYFIKDIAHTPSSEAVRRSIPVEKPRLYYGELTNTYVMPSSRVPELDFPSGSENVYNRYDGQGGINIGPRWKRFLFAKHLGDWKMLLTDDFTADTKLMFRRNIKQRINRIAPFLQFDEDPYLVIADAGANFATPGEESGTNYLYWMIDAYTTSDRYPYADPGTNPYNYIRNSVKVVVDAYNGSVHFYIADERDPIIRTWAQIFPAMFEPLSAMPETLRAHIRYPQDFSLVQSDQLLAYHMTDPQVFYNREDLWRAPNEIYASETQVVKPYYLIMELPEEDDTEFVLLRPFTPAQRNNLVAWLAARSDGQQYGRQLLYQFPKQELVFGPEQIEARINQEPDISQRISLWNTQGSRANQGNLLVIPIEQSLLYVEPLYLEAEQNRLPILARVIIAYKNRIAMAQTLEQGLQAIFGGEESASPAIIRELDQPDSVEELLLPSEDPATPDDSAPTEDS
ncbi:UPF0182 family protein [cf. Phormidesmis sp. LEGE 11477]|uniref:UPF0182 family protein n=1 Tax=cf. Phormidesmis sp. LEGE 11477 TaxID=1828680 RepID=UPI001881AFF0|nr:UPF0182 family protein [cf. Phormidesmis sp. LEGE 11477]MBE9060734.1 UPF0182 family protein [cf. Phormidesmis sp. LEGE 11477]